MLDYSGTNSRANSTRRVTDPMSLTDGVLPQPDNTQFDQLCEALLPSAPANTPSFSPKRTEGTPQAVVKSRKENIQRSPAPASAKDDSLRIGGGKRQRLVTPLEKPDERRGKPQLECAKSMH